MEKRIPYVDVRGYNEKVTGSSIRNTVHFSDGTIFRFLVDHGMYQGEGHKGIEYNDSINPKKIDAILLTHTHLDHDGALPIFVRKGYKKNIYMSKGSEAVLDIGLMDSYNIMKRNAKLKKRPILFSEEDVNQTLRQVKASEYGEAVKIHPYINITFFNNAHLPGASVILVQIDEPMGIINLLYTGDYNSENILLNIDPLPSWEYALPNLTIVAESTYGTTNSWEVEKTWEDDIVEACKQNLLVFNSVFGQCRAQTLLFRTRRLQDNGLIPKDYPVKIAGKTTSAYTFRYLDKHNVLNLREEAINLLPYNVQFVDDKTMPDMLNIKNRALFFSTSGMGSNGPAATFIPHFLPNPHALIYIPGYASEGTLARKIIEADYGEEINFKDGSSAIKRAEVKQTGEFSSHAPADKIIEFLNMFTPMSILFTHGDPDRKEALAERAKIETGVKKIGILGMGYVYRINSYGIAKKVKK